MNESFKEYNKMMGLKHDDKDIINSDGRKMNFG